MKPFIPYSLLAAAAACGMAFGQAYTTPVGYTTQNLASGQFNLVGLNVQTPTLIAGDISAVNGAVVTDTGAGFGAALPAGRTIILEITSGAAEGTVQEFDTWAGDDVTLPSAIPGLAANDSYRIRVAPTLEETFQSSLTASFTAAGADIIWLPDGAGGYDKYYFALPGPVVKTFEGVNAPNVPIVYVDGILIQKKGTAGSVVLTGEVKTDGTNILLAGGAINPISIVAPVGLTLATSGLADDLTASFTAAGADVVWVPVAGGSYEKYGLRLPGPTWQKIDAAGNFDGVTLVDFELPPSILIQRKGGATVVDLDVPASYSNL